ncbi:tyrosine-type recombinase/integrase [Cytobacillus horneckiae]
MIDTKYLVICTETGTPINPRNLLRSFYSLTEKAKLPKITFHDLRHTYATFLLENGVNIKVISERLGMVGWLLH